MKVELVGGCEGGLHGLTSNAGGFWEVGLHAIPFIPGNSPLESGAMEGGIGLVLTIVDNRPEWSSNGCTDEHGEDKKTWRFFSNSKMEEERGGGIYVTVCKKIAN